MYCMILSSKKMTSWKKLAELITVPYNIPLFPDLKVGYRSGEANQKTYQKMMIFDFETLFLGQKFEKLLS